MRRVLRPLLIGSGLLCLGRSAAYAYFVYVPAPQVPQLSAPLQRGSLRVGALQRSYVFFVPARLAPHPPLLLAVHGSRGNARQMRGASGYRFEELADEHGFILAYPEG